MAKASDKFYGFLMFLAIIVFIIKEFWPIILIITLVIILIYYGGKFIIEEKEELKSKIISISEIDKMDGISFEYYVSKLLKKQGYSAKVTKGSNDFGVDIIAKKKFDKYAIQVKRYKSNVSRRAISDAVAGMAKYNCNKSMVITNSYFSKAAIELAKVNSCILIDRDILYKWILKYQKSR